MFYTKILIDDQILAIVWLWKFVPNMLFFPIFRFCFGLSSLAGDVHLMGWFWFL